MWGGRLIDERRMVKLTSSSSTTRSNCSSVTAELPAIVRSPFNIFSHASSTGSRSYEQDAFALAGVFDR